MKYRIGVARCFVVIVLVDGARWADATNRPAYQVFPNLNRIDGQRKLWVVTEDRGHTFSRPNSFVSADDTVTARGRPPCVGFVGLVGFCWFVPKEIHFVIAMSFGGPRGEDTWSMKR